MTAMRTRKNTTAIATPFNTTNRCERGYFNDSKNHLEEKEPLGNVREQDMSAIWCEGDPDKYIFTSEDDSPLVHKWCG